jgi:Sec-independent protein translocase protein TatA
VSEADTHLMGFGGQLPLVVALGFLVLGPKRMHAILEQLARTKAEFEKDSRGIKSQIAAEFDGAAVSAGEKTKPGPTANSVS